MDFFSAEKAQWNVSLEPVDSVFTTASARSKDAMPGGIGYEVHLDFTTEQWSILYGGNELKDIDIEGLVERALANMYGCIEYVKGARASDSNGTIDSIYKP